MLYIFLCLVRKGKNNIFYYSLRTRFPFNNNKKETLSFLRKIKHGTFRLVITFQVSLHIPWRLQYFLSILSNYCKLSIIHLTIMMSPSSSRPHSALSVACFSLSLGAESCVSCYCGDERCKWRQLSTWHPGSEFPTPPRGNRGVFLPLFLSDFSLSPFEMCHSLLLSQPPPHTQTHTHQTFNIST